MPLLSKNQLAAQNVVELSDVNAMLQSAKQKRIVFVRELV